MIGEEGYEGGQYVWGLGGIYIRTNIGLHMCIYKKLSN